MIDQKGFRENIAIIILNHQNKVLWARRIRQLSWQFPQGGLNSEEKDIEGMYRELKEEVGLSPYDVKIVSQTSDWIYYKLPKFLVRRNLPLCIGQKQKWFLLKLISCDTSINLNLSNKPEFDKWRWVDYWYPTSNIIFFKRSAYKKALSHFYSFIK